MSTEPKNTATTEKAQGTTGPREKRPDVTREDCGLPKDLPPGIRMEWIKLDRHLPLPGDSNAQHINALEPLPNGKRWEIEFIPQIRHYRVTCYPADRSKAPDTDLIPECRITHSRPLTPAAIKAASAKK